MKYEVNGFTAGVVSILLIFTGCGNQPSPTLSPSPTSAILSPTFTPAPTPTLPSVAVTPIAYPNETIMPENVADMVELGFLPPPLEGELVGISDFALLPVSTADNATDKIFVAHGAWQGQSLIKGIPVWDIATGKLEQIFALSQDIPIYKLAISADGKRLITIGNVQYSVSMWDVSTDQLLDERLVLTSTPAYNIAISPDGQLVAEVVGLGGAVHVFSVHQQWPPLYGLGHEEIGIAVRDTGIEMAFSADGTKLASIGVSRDVYLWDMKTGELIWKQQGGNNLHYSNNGLSFTSDNRLLATADDEMIWIWDVENGDVVHQMANSEKYWRSLAFSPDGRLLAAGTRNLDHPDGGSGKATLQIWEVETGQLSRIWDHPADVTKVAFSHDGKLLISGASDGVVRLWGVSPIE